MSDEITKPSATHDNSLAPELSYFGRIRSTFDASYLKQDKITFIHGTIVNI